MSKSNNIIYVCLFLFLLGLFFFFNPATSSFFLKCPIHYFTGLHCPGCGTQRAIYAILHLDLYSAWQFNPLIFLIIPSCIYLMLCKTLGWNTKWLNNPYFMGFWILFVISYFILRNIPYEPFSTLAPG